MVFGQILRYPADHSPSRIKKVDKSHVKECNFKDIKSLIKIRDAHKVRLKELYH